MNITKELIMILLEILLLYNFSELPSLIHYFYFWYSIVYLIGRTCIVYLCAASINDESKKPLKIIRLIPTTGLCMEVSIPTYRQ